MQTIEIKGNKDLLTREKTLFLCSKKTPLTLYDYIFQWTEKLGDRDCIACFNSTDMESEVLKALLVSKIPTILFVMNRFSDVNNIQIEKALQENRLAIVVLRRDEPQGKGPTPRLRNIYVLSLCQHVVCGYINKNGTVFGLLAGRNDVEWLIDDQKVLTAAEPILRYERWTVAQDKVLLRMFYADMGIDAIHKRLHRSYTAVYSRIHSITQPEELLKGREFEDFVLSLFNIHTRGDLVLQEWQGDKSSGNIHPENNSNPDFVFRYRQKEFAIECKWREKLNRDLEKDLFPIKRIEQYTIFSATRNMPVSIILGVGGDPCNPEVIYNIPLESISSLTSGAIHLTKFLSPMNSFDASTFIREGEAEDISSTIEEKHEHYPNAYKLWSSADDEKLLILYHEKKSIKELSYIFKRSEKSIRSRIKKLMNTSEK